MTEQNSKIQQNSSDEDEIDLIALAKTLWGGRKTVIKTTLIFMAIGLFVAIFSEKEYLSITKFIPQSSDSEIKGSLGGLAAMAGLNIGGLGGDSGIPPSLYPQIMSSIPFQRELLKTKLTIDGEKDKVSFYDYYDLIYRPSLIGYVKKYTIKLPNLVRNIFKSKNTSYSEEKFNTSQNQVIIITEDEYELIERLKDQVFLEVNENDGFVTISTNMPQPIASAELAYNTQLLLQKYLIDFKVQKSKEQLDFMNSRYTEAEVKFKDAQQKLAKYRDRNKNVVTALGGTTLELLQDEYDLQYSVYSQLAKQLEAQYIKVREDTPVFTILEPAMVPIEKYKPKRIMILVIYSFLGGMIGVGIVFGNFYLKPLFAKRT
ncbi:LPS O-antigen chain length determinant protein, WzzB/FepE family [Lutibacter agarilyticus]|uniref:LPS O-antigen chain length determinant protein, WzzB/FepE family n=1 Tax=Lutibacter agarilyticus TaxID=1109740 RepID=A0A238WU58_9FLAO|nr:Wzz/FepE/Etk N-terminal domain-containing protein [Lutibacter agarilyticus]SNR49958.1 LPS O-antigen chain length determinant protein, WzzB/FepE family [Lutibacter agarilyticus]